MTFTLWSRGELLGESTLDYVRVIPHLRTGDLYPTDKGLIVFERLSQFRADAYYAARRINKKATFDESDLKTVQADLAAQNNHYEALAMELHTSEGVVIPTDDIWVTDTEYLLSIAREADEEDETPLSAEAAAHVEEAVKEIQEHLRELEENSPPWLPDGPEREPVRFQVSVILRSEFSIP